MAALMTFDTFPVSAHQRHLFKIGQLAQEWYEKYPTIFDEDDLRLAKSQPDYHFFEWLAAILLYQSIGYYSLIEKYKYTKGGHKRKKEIVSRLNSTSLNAAIAHRGNYGYVQCPDLLVYAPDLTNWFFCEVKGGKDKLSEKQELHFQALQGLTGKPVRFIQFHYVDLSTP